ncbi:phosphodiester glycosidase family protein [Acinetobacter sp. WU_MDCI_Axc73]|nr:phosphodiester glycosidase family protein [Acinetobacter sp. WU_MDCI_Axc73]
MRILKKWLVLSLLSIGSAHLAYANEDLSYQHVQTAQGVDADVFQIHDLSKLRLFLDDQREQLPLLKFKNIQQQLQPCETLDFAMNAGMYHPNYMPVGLYIENGQQKQALNLDEGWGNFFIQPNGVLAWNTQQALITTTQDFQKSNFKASYATQSGPMLLIKGKINPKFTPDSSSLKIRNGVGIKDHSLYFVITRNRVNFYQFADFFKDQLNINDALYLDGSISSLYFPAIGRQDQRYNLGPMLALIHSNECHQ